MNQILPASGLTKIKHVKRYFDYKKNVFYNLDTNICLPNKDDLSNCGRQTTFVNN